ncbi:MAG: YicC/YloC family endoribonuclease [Planctomycetota bacterium]
MSTPPQSPRPQSPRSQKLLRSMTGSAWAKVVGEGGGSAVVVELRSVNGRGFALKARLPAELSSFERGMEERIRARVHRGSVSLTVTLERSSRDLAGVLDSGRFAEVAAELQRLASACGLSAPTVRDVLVVPGVLASSGEISRERGETVPAAVQRALDDALDRLIASREAEGAALYIAIESHLLELESALATVAARTPELGARYRDRLLARVNEVLNGSGVTRELSPADVLQQVALYCDRVDVREELDRLSAHLARARVLLAGSEPPGRNLEFLTQEILREVNTIGSKSPDAEIAHEIVAMKSIVDRLKEQVANLE